MALDLSLPAGQELLRALLADVLVENFKPGTLEKWGLGYETLSQAFPKLIHCRVSGFGADGPLGGLPGYDACAQAMCGLMSVNGEADGEATRVGLPVVDMVTGLNAAVAVLLGAERARAAALGSSWTSRCTTARCRCCTRTRPTISTAARRRPAAAMRIPTSRPMKRCPPPAARSSWPWATTASSRSWPPRWARPNWRETATRPTPTGWPTASPCATPCRRCWRRTRPLRWRTGCCARRARRRRADSGPGPGPSAYPPSRHAAGTGRLPGRGLADQAVAHARQAAQAAAGAGRPGTRGRLADRAGDTA